MADKIQTFFEKYGEALVSYSPKKISSFYKVPLAVYSDNGVLLVSKEEDVVAFWQNAVTPYKQSGISGTVANVIMEEQLSEKVYVVKVEWMNNDEAGRKVQTETNFYILSGNDETLKISGLILVTK